MLTGGDQGISLVLEIEDPFFLNVPRCGPGVSRDDISWTRAISWKTTNDVPSNLSLAIAVCSWPELIPAIETGNRSTMFCITCRYKVSIRTQVLQVRVSTQFFESLHHEGFVKHKYFSTKQIPRRKKYNNITRPQVQQHNKKSCEWWRRKAEYYEFYQQVVELEEATWREVVLRALPASGGVRGPNYRAIVAYQDLDCWNQL